MVTSLKVEDKLDGATNFTSSKTRILFILEENEIQDYVQKGVSESEDDEGKSSKKKNEAKAKRILVDSVKDHLIPHIVQMKTAKEMYDALTRLFESKNTNTKLALRYQLCGIMMSRSDSIATYFMRVSQLRDQRQAIGDTIDDAKLVTVTLNGFPSSWEPFVQGICA